MDAPRVLLVDGEPLRLRSLASALAGDGFEVLESADGGEAAALCRRRHPEVVVLDGATLRRDGGRALEAWRKGGAPRAAACMIFLTGRSDPDDRRLGDELGATDFLARPFAPTLLARRARELLAAGAGRGAPPQREP
ncbi:MAG TPA: response regulator [Planctomycetota bacterium]|jgi:DNA-binding response OmpR family regulator|nr:response regulator [Planctomycetota bacterium]